MRIMGAIAGAVLVATSGGGLAYSPSGLDPLLMDGLWHMGPEGSADSCAVRLSVSPWTRPDGSIGVVPGKVEADAGCLDRLMPSNESAYNQNRMGDSGWSTGVGSLNLGVHGRGFSMSYQTDVYLSGSYRGVPGSVVMFRDGFEAPALRTRIIADREVEIARANARIRAGAGRFRFTWMTAWLLAVVVFTAVFSWMVASSLSRRLRPHLYRLFFG